MPYTAKGMFLHSIGFNYIVHGKLAMLSQNSQTTHLKLRVIQGLKLLEGGQVHEKNTSRCIIYRKLSFDPLKRNFSACKFHSLIFIIFTGQVVVRQKVRYHFPSSPIFLQQTREKTVLTSCFP